MLTPFYYQQECIDATIDCLMNTDLNPCLKIPTAGGKSLIQAEIARRVFDMAPNYTQIFLTDVTALIGQNRDELLEQWHDADATVYSASYGKKNHKGKLVFCGIQSIYKQANLFSDVAVVYIDEAHRASLAEKGMYKKFIDDLKKNNPKVRIVTLSATPWKLLTGTIEGTWICDEIIYEIQMKTLFEKGFLCPIVTPEVSAHVSFDKVKIGSSGEYNEAALAELMDDDYLINAALDDAMKYAADRNSGLIFACNIAHAEHIQSALKRRGEVAEVIIGDTETKDRTEIIGRFKNHKLRWLISVGTLTTGFNAKNADLLIMMRATQSSSLWLQILGRVLRTHPSKANAMVLDYGGNIDRFGQIDKIGPPPTKEEKKQAKKTPFKICSNDQCQKTVGYLEKSCPFCLTEFGGVSTPNHGTQASTDDLTTHKQKVDEFIVSNVVYTKHVTKEGEVSLKVSYVSGISLIHDYLHFEGANWKRIQACRWWEKHAADDIRTHCPKHIDTAIAELNAYGLKPVNKIFVDVTTAKKNAEWRSLWS